MLRQGNEFIEESITYAGDIEIMRKTELCIDGKKMNIAEECDIKVAYLCDRRACDACSAGCGYTTNIEHATNFKREGTVMVDS